MKINLFFHLLFTLTLNSCKEDLITKNQKFYNLETETQSTPEEVYNYLSDHLCFYNIDPSQILIKKEVPANRMFSLFKSVKDFYDKNTITIEGKNYSVKDYITMVNKGELKISYQEKVSQGTITVIDDSKIIAGIKKNFGLPPSSHQETHYTYKTETEVAPKGILFEEGKGLNAYREIQTSINEIKENLVGGLDLFECLSSFKSRFKDHIEEKKNNNEINEIDKKLKCLIQKKPLKYTPIDLANPNKRINTFRKIEEFDQEIVEEILVLLQKLNLLNSEIDPTNSCINRYIGLLEEIKKEANATPKKRRVHFANKVKVKFI